MAETIVTFWKFILRQWSLYRLRRSLRQEFPRLYELYMASDRDNQRNYFEHPNCLNAILRREEQLQAIESCLQQMDSRAWQVFKAKTVRSLTITDKWSWNSELFDRFDEARAYCHLKEKGYSDIQFITEDQKAKTPDLWANGNDGPVMVEVKSIHESDDENDHMTRRGKYAQEKDAIEVEYFLGPAAKTKLEKTIRKAAQQLSYQGREASKRILFLCIRLDLRCATQRTFAELKEFLASVKLKDVEIEHVIKNTIIL